MDLGDLVDGEGECGMRFSNFSCPEARGGGGGSGSWWRGGGTEVAPGWENISKM